MSVQLEAAVVRDEPVLDEPKGWNPATRLLFRFCFLYFGLFCVIYPQPIFALFGITQNWLSEDVVKALNSWPSPVVEWVGRTVFGVNAELNFSSGSGDQTYLWVLVFCILVTAVAGTVVWILLDRRRTEYRRLAGWFLLFLRVILAGQMLGYGFAKAIPNQMQVPDLVTMLTPYGEFTHMAVLWSQVGTSPVYQSLLGIAEVLGGVLLLLPRTVLAGVLLSLVSMAQVWVLNMTYDVPVKLLSFHLLLLSLVLLAPEAKRLLAFLSGSASGPTTAPNPFTSRKARRISAAALAVVLAWFVLADVVNARDGWREYGGGREKPELYGIWAVTEFTRDGQPVPPLLTDETRWRRLIFDYPNTAVYQRMDDGFVPIAAEIDSAAHRLTVRAPGGDAPLGSFTFERPQPERLMLTGELEGRPVTIALDLVDSDRFPLRQGGLHLIQDFPDGVR
ncbi:DoxX family protein [Nocardia sp. 2]|uniref:DoxX family protein n=1 Tax=Nocardia acididurans TaxID=2802282 RepID=A0ABS1MEL4_9NOCA|nr:DoxX family protein [Nocardia acididurans]MBL1078997.1 DoxX family protein [Nocardia acididurans]